MRRARDARRVGQRGLSIVQCLHMIGQTSAKRGVVLTVVFVARLAAVGRCCEQLCANSAAEAVRGSRAAGDNGPTLSGVQSVPTVGPAGAATH